MKQVHLANNVQGKSDLFSQWQAKTQSASQLETRALQLNLVKITPQTIKQEFNSYRN